MLSHFCGKLLRKLRMLSIIVIFLKMDNLKVSQEKKKSQRRVDDLRFFTETWNLVTFSWMTSQMLKLEILGCQDKWTKSHNLQWLMLALLITWVLNKLLILNMTINQTSGLLGALFMKLHVYDHLLKQSLNQNLQRKLNQETFQHYQKMEIIHNEFKTLFSAC